MASSKRASEVPHYGLHASPTKKVPRWIQLPLSKSAPASPISQTSKMLLTKPPPLVLETPSRRAELAFHTSPSSSSSRSTVEISPTPSAATDNLAPSASSTHSATPSTQPLGQNTAQGPVSKEDSSITLKDLFDMPMEDFLAAAKASGLEWADHGHVLPWVGETGYPDLEAENQAFTDTDTDTDE